MVIKQDSKHMCCYIMLKFILYISVLEANLFLVFCKLLINFSVSWGQRQFMNMSAIYSVALYSLKDGNCF